MQQTTTSTTTRHQGLRREEVKSAIDAYEEAYDRAESEPVREQYQTLLRQFYDLVTDFYEFGWGRSFHFAPRRRGESLATSIARYESYFADRLGLHPGMRVIDLGCGVGGPMRQIARVSGAHVTGVNIDAYQVAKTRRYNAEAGLESRCEVIEADFLHIPVKDGSFDAAYAFEATCHAPDKVSIFSEAARVLVPGALFAGCEWCVTPAYDRGNPEHRRVKRDIERGNALSNLATFEEVNDGLEKSGFELLEAQDLAPSSDPMLPWYSPLSGVELSLTSIPRLPYGRAVVNAVTGLLELVRLAPKGTRQVSSLLNLGADVLVEGGELGIFTPMYFFIARKRSAVSFQPSAADS
jgi:sterol 24-C-methyltransferase